MKNVKIPVNWQRWSVEKYQAGRDLLFYKTKKELKSYFPDIVDYEGHNWTKVEIIPYILNEWGL